MKLEVNDAAVCMLEDEVPDLAGILGTARAVGWARRGRWSRWLVSASQRSKNSPNPRDHVSTHTLVHACTLHTARVARPHCRYLRVPGCAVLWKQLYDYEACHMWITSLTAYCADCACSRIISPPVVLLLQLAMQLLWISLVSERGRVMDRENTRQPRKPSHSPMPDLCRELSALAGVAHSAARRSMNAIVVSRQYRTQSFQQHLKADGELLD